MSTGERMFALLVVLRAVFVVPLGAAGWAVFAWMVGWIADPEMLTVLGDAWIPWVVGGALAWLPAIAGACVVASFACLAGSIAALALRRDAASLLLAFAAGTALLVPFVDIAVAFGAWGAAQTLCAGDLTCF